MFTQQDYSYTLEGALSSRVNGMIIFNITEVEQGYYEVVLFQDTTRETQLGEVVVAPGEKEVKFFRDAEGDSVRVEVDYLINAVTVRETVLDAEDPDPYSDYQTTVTFSDEGVVSGVVEKDISGCEEDETFVKVNSFSEYSKEMGENLASALRECRVGLTFMAPTDGDEWVETAVPNYYCMVKWGNEWFFYPDLEKALGSYLMGLRSVGSGMWEVIKSTAFNDLACYDIPNWVYGFRYILDKDDDLSLVMDKSKIGIVSKNTGKVLWEGFITDYRIDEDTPHHPMICRWLRALS